MPVANQPVQQDKPVENQPVQQDEPAAESKPSRPDKPTTRPDLSEKNTGAISVPTR